MLEGGQGVGEHHEGPPHAQCGKSLQTRACFRRARQSKVRWVRRGCGRISSSRVKLWVFVPPLRKALYESRRWVAGTRKGGDGELAFSRVKVSVGDDEKVLDMNGSDSSQ